MAAPTTQKGSSLRNNNMERKKKKESQPQRAILSLAGNDAESIWVQKLKGKRYEVRTIPFWAYNLSLGDVVECHPDEDGLGLFIGRVVQKSGNRTVRVAIENQEGLAHPAGRKLIEYLKECGLRRERFGVRYLSINVPSEEEYRRLIERLDELAQEAELIWEDGDPEPTKNMDTSDVVPAEKSD